MKENGTVTAGVIPSPETASTIRTAPGSANVRSQALRNGQPGPPNFTIWSALELLFARWHWLVLGMLIGGAAFYCLAWYFIRPKFTASAQLLRYEPMGRSDYFKTTPISSDTFANLIKAPELLEDVGAQITPPVRAETFAKWIKVEADPDSDLVKLYLAARHPQEAVDWLNVYATNAVEYTRRLESKQLSNLAKGYLQKEVQEIDSDVTAVEHQFQALPSA
ncbi:MAG TPA: hypothetical protein VHI52_00675, partial [Verrucomicrobiae bacterium]|nr:hypothetical protein [Verrucomicrobiae bacterium]